MRALIALAIAIATLSACSSTGDMVALKEHYDSTIVEGQWRVDCTYDQYKSERTCFAGTFGDDHVGQGALKFFQIAYVNKNGPLVYTPNDFPGRIATVRVDNGPVLSADHPGEIVAALKQGTTAFVTFNVWPHGEERMTVALTGFAAAYVALQAKI